MFLLLITSRIAIRLFSFNKILLFIKKLAFSGALKNGFYPLQSTWLLRGFLGNAQLEYFKFQNIVSKEPRDIPEPWRLRNVLIESHQIRVEN